MGTWVSLNNKPTANIGTMLLLTDGSVLCADTGSPRWFRLTPDNKGSYINGTWSQLANGPNAPLYFASAVLKNGRVFVAGGEYEDGMEWDLLAAEIYNPDSDYWSVAKLPPGWPNVGDAPSCMLPDGRILVGSINSPRTAIYDPDDNTWTAAADKKNPSSSEETWTLLPDETILAVECDGHPGAEKYIIAADTWIQIAPTPTDLVEASSIEIGPAILLPDGRVFCTGATGSTALYQPPAIASQPGVWTTGPNFPPQPGHPDIGAKDAPACLLPNGKVLCVAGPVDGISDHYLAPMFFFEFDPVSETFALIAGPATNPSNFPAFVGRFLVVPNGDVLFANGTNIVSVYQPGGAAPNPSWLPTIVRITDANGNPVTNITVSETFILSGRQLNGLSQANSYGDDAQMATNYPLVRIRHNGSGDIVYCPTEDHSSMGVATGSVVQTTHFSVPPGTSLGASTLEVVANGIASAPLALAVV
jgi:hypothetical protein